MNAHQTCWLAMGGFFVASGVDWIDWSYWYLTPLLYIGWYWWPVFNGFRKGKHK